MSVDLISFMIDSVRLEDGFLLNLTLSEPTLTELRLVCSGFFWSFWGQVRSNQFHYILNEKFGSTRSIFKEYFTVHEQNEIKNGK